MARNAIHPGEHLADAMAALGITAARLARDIQVPANRIGHSQFSAAQLKTIQEVITLVVFCVFSVVYLKEELKWNYLAGFVLMVGAVFVIFKEW